MTEPLVATNVSVSFSGLKALTDLSLKVLQGEIVGLIGGNGAGKTTFMDCVSGHVQPEPGSSICSFDRELVGESPELRPYAGVGRSYQHARLFPGLSVTETLLVAVERHHPTGVLPALLHLRSARAAEREKSVIVDRLVETCGLDSYRDQPIQELSTGTRRVVDIAGILAQQPKLLLLDEPTSGLAQRETEAFGPLIHRVRDELDCSILIVEHDIVLISSISDRVYALESGRVIAEGVPDVIRRDPRVVASYLGTDEAAIRRSGALEEDDGLERLPRAELRSRAIDAGVNGRARMTKAELIAALRADDGIRR